MIKVRVYRLGKEVGVFKTLADASRALNINRVYITRALKETIKICQGYRFEVIRRGHGRKRKSTKR